MTFDALVGLVGSLSCFDLAMVVQLTGERRQSVTNQLSRLVKAGKVTALRRGLYVLAEHYRRTSVQPAELAGLIYRPSYLSGLWALSFYGLIPEGVPVFTSVTSRSPRRFTNSFGAFYYRHLKQSLFFGAKPMLISGRRVMVASPEKALVDHWHLNSGEWSVARMREMRFSPTPVINSKKLKAMLNEIDMPRLYRAYEVWRIVLNENNVAEVIL